MYITCAIALTQITQDNRQNKFLKTTQNNRPYNVQKRC